MIQACDRAALLWPLSHVPGNSHFLLLELPILINRMHALGKFSWLWKILFLNSCMFGIILSLNSNWILDLAGINILLITFAKNYESFLRVFWLRALLRNVMTYRYFFLLHKTFSVEGSRGDLFFVCFVLFCFVWLNCFKISQLCSLVWVNFRSWCKIPGESLELGKPCF